MTDINNRTDIYPMVPATVAPALLKKLPDLETGGLRNRRVGCYLSVAVIRGLESHRDPLILQGDMPMILVDADTLEDLRERAIDEINVVFENARKLETGELTMEDLEREAALARDKIEQELKASIDEDVPPEAFKDALEVTELSPNSPMASEPEPAEVTTDIPNSTI